MISGVGLLKGYKLKLHVDESMKPVAQHVHRLQKKVDAKLDELLKLDIIEEVSERLSAWISPLVVASKGDGEVRVCVNMRQANGAINKTAQASVLLPENERTPFFWLYIGFAPFRALS